LMSDNAQQAFPWLSLFGGRFDEAAFDVILGNCNDAMDDLIDFGFIETERETKDRWKNYWENKSVERWQGTVIRSAIGPFDSDDIDKIGRPKITDQTIADGEKLIPSMWYWMHDVVRSFAARVATLSKLGLPDDVINPEHRPAMMKASTMDNKLS